jgi:hypothetical protein
LYYSIYDKIKDVLKEYRKARRLVKEFTAKQAARYAVIEREYTPYSRSNGANVYSVYIPQMLKGFISSCFPLLSLSGVLQLALLNFFASGRFTDFDIEASEIFLEDCKYQLERHVDGYVNLLRRFVNEVNAIVEEKDPLEELILSSLPATFFDIYDKAKTIGYDPDEIMFKLKDLIRRGKIKVEGERLLLGGGSHE